MQKVSATVKSNGELLEFPDWRDAKMLDQTRAQARWLSDYLYGKTGERVPVQAVLEMPRCGFTNGRRLPSNKKPSASCRDER